MVELGKVKSLTSWPGMRGKVEKLVTEAFGELPKDKPDLQVKTVDEIEFAGYVRRRVNYFVDSWDRVSGWLFLPEGKEELPAIVCLHQRVPQGKEEPAGMSGDSRFNFAQRYAEMGYVAFAPDCLTAGERRIGRAPHYDSRPYYKAGTKASLAIKMVADHMRALDLLQDQKRVDGERIGVVGHGLGAFNALLLTAFDDRVRACVASCGFTRFAQDNQLARYYDDDGLCLIPRMKQVAEGESLGFDWEHILALGAPSPTLVVNTTKDTPLPSPKSAEKAVNTARQVYKMLGAEGALDYYEHGGGYTVTDEVLELAEDWFDRWL